MRIVVVQLAATAVAVAAVFISDDRLVYIAAYAVAALAVAYACFGYLYKQSRSLAERARRLTLLKGGLGESLSAPEFRELLGRFSDSVTRNAKTIDSSGYYDCQSQPGPGRLVEMIEESAFWSEDLYRHSSRRAILWAGGGLLLSVMMVTLVAIPGINAELGMNSGRVVFALVPFLLSGEVFGSAAAYGVAAHELARILAQLEIQKAKGITPQAALVLFAEYNSAVEGAPPIFPGIYKARRSDLNERWSRR